jgi:putative transposase
MRLNTHCHCTYSLTAHLVLVTKDRYKLLNKSILTEFKDIVNNLANLWNIQILEVNGENDHVHLLISYYPTLELAKFVNNIKTVTSRLLRKHNASLKRHKVLWSRSYCILSTGGATIEVIKKYIENQGKPKTV